MFSKAIALASLANMASAHMAMTNPVPYGKSSLTNSPLDGAGADFPCKQRPGVYDAQGASNVYAQGSSQQLAFIGGAVHGGGSCQVSVTTDLQPSKNSVWKVIKSIEGGCPAKNAEGNIGGDASAADPFKYDYTIPKELAAGNYTLAWTWFNKIGNREMYMNCAPLTVTGNAGSQSFLNGLPNMFVANIGNGCSTLETTDVEFPNPGQDVDRFNGQTTAFKPPVGSCATAAPGGGNSPSSVGGSQPTSAPVAQPTANPPQAGPSAAPSIPGGVFITKSQPAQTEPVQTQPAATNEVPAPVPSNGNGSDPASPTGTGSSPAPTTGTGGNGGNGGNGGAGGFAQGTACTTEGEWNCIGGTSFQRCASGMWSATQGVASGTKCSSGQSSDLQITWAGKSRRNLRRAMRFAA